MFDRLRVYFSMLGSMFFILWIIVFIVTFADSLCGPAVPYLLKRFLVEEAAVVAMVGYLNSLFNLVKTGINIPGAVLADKLERRVIILISLCFLPISFLLLLLATDSWWVLWSYVVFGVFTGLSFPSFEAMVADLAPKNARGMAFAVFNFSWIISQMLGPALGGFLSDAFFLRFPFFLGLFISIGGLLTFWIYLRRFFKRRKLVSRAYSAKASGGGSEEHAIPFGPTMGLLCGMQFFSGLGNGVLMPITIAFLMYALGTSPTEMGMAFSIGWGVATALAQIPGGKVADKLGPKPVIIMCTLFSAALLFLQPLSMNVFQFTLILGLICFIGNLSSPAFSAWVASLIGTERRGKGYGLTSAAWGAGAIIGPIIGSFTWTLFEPNRLLPFIVATVPFFLELPFVILIKNSSK